MILNHPHARKPIRRWAFVITGFLQNAGTRTRMIELWRGLHATGNSFSRAELRPWCADWEAEAELLMRSSFDTGVTNRPTIMIFAYSWGAGWGAMRLAQALDNRGIIVDSMVLSDPVYRHWYWAGNWRAFWPYSSIYVPSNVKEVRWFKQRKNWPRGHNLKAIDPNFTRIHDPLLINATHQNMDESVHFLTECEVVATQLLPETR